MNVTIEVSEIVLTLLASSECLSKTLHGEARSETQSSQLDVAAVVLNRVYNSPKYPNTICEVTEQPNQFSSRQRWDVNYYYTERVYAGFETTASERKIKKELDKLSISAILNYKQLKSYGDVYHFYHKDYPPYWAESERLTYSHTSGVHVFLKGY